MKQNRSDVESVVRWRDRPEGGASDEDRAAALTRDALDPHAFPVGLDDQRLLAIEWRLMTARRAGPPFWLRPALVAVLVSMSVAVMGYETGWFAPLRERLRLRSIPAATPEPIEHAKRHASHAQTAPTPALSPAPLDGPATAHAELPAPLPAPVVSAAPVRKVALAANRPAAPTAIVASPPPAASEEIQALERAVGLLRGKHDAPGALAALDEYIARFPRGVLVHEARVARIDALLMLGRADDALGALDALPLDAHRRSTELQLIRGELRARTDCGRAEADFTAVLARVQTASLEERALYGRAACRNTLGNALGAAGDLRRYVERFPGGAHAGWARQYLENSR